MGDPAKYLFRATLRMKRAHTTDERRSRSRPSTEKGRAKRLTHFSDGLLDTS
ncbi:MAG: hypothetical protein KTR25_07630 [Myxococcales bacterium]|nr:hypothetical protein [Myxococcales bacterium]